MPPFENEEQYAAIPDRKGRVDPRWYVSALAIGYVFYQLFDFFFEEWATNLPVHKQVYILGSCITNIACVFVLAISLLMLASRRVEYKTSQLRQTAVLPLLLFYVWLHLFNWHMHQKQPWMFIEDVARSTVTSNQLLINGINPYSFEMDPTSAELLPGRNVNGYKYLPVMLAAYAPVNIFFRDTDWGMLFANLIYSIFAGAVVGLCLRRWISTDAALVGMTLFFMATIVGQDQISNGANDAIPMILVFFALLAVERRLLCGLLIGLSIGSKILPGMIWIPLLLTPRRRGRYFTGIALGLLPCLPFFVWNPSAFVGNIFLYNVIRPVQDTSLVFEMPKWIQLIAKSPGMLLYAGIFWKNWRRPMPPLLRCGWGVPLTFSVILAAPINHTNYIIWWFMPLCVLTTAVIFNPASYRWMFPSLPSPVEI